MNRLVNWLKFKLCGNELIELANLKRNINDIKIVDRQSHDVYPKVAKLVGMPTDTLKATRLHVLIAKDELPEVRVRYGLIPESSDGEANE